MDKRFWAILGVIFAVFVGFLIFKGDKTDAPTSNAKPTEHVQRAEKAAITLTEYGDYQCPYCGAFYPTVKETLAKYKDQVTFQFRNYPLQQVHQNAFAAARAAEAADLQGKFWEMNSALFSTQSSWSTSNSAQSAFNSYAEQLGLDINKFKQDYSSSKVNDIINADIAEFNKLGLTKSTPTFLIDGKQVKPENTVESFSKVIDEAIAAKKQ